MSKSAALSIDPAALELMEELSRELPSELERYTQAEDSLESRKRQTAEAATINQPGKIPPTEDKDVISQIDDVPPVPSPDNPDLEIPELPSKEKDKRNPIRPRRFAEAYSNYTSQTFEPRNGGPKTSTTSPATPRSYRVAIRSVRAARGIAIGGSVNSEIKDKPIGAVWLPNRKDNRFGRLFVQFPSEQGSAPLVAASRVLFADSFYAATSVLREKHHDGEATFRDGEILVLMSMDPDAQ